jgi:hypothetical protein
MAQHSSDGVGTFGAVMNPLRRRIQLTAAVVAVGLLLSACASDGGTDNSSGPSATPAATAPDEQPDATTPDDATAPIAPTTPGDASATTVTPVVVPEALQFTAPLVGGGEFVGAEYAGKPTVFWFWAPT